MPQHITSPSDSRVRATEREILNEAPAGPLGDLLTSALEQIEGAAHASISLVSDGAFRLVASTNLDVDQALDPTEGPQNEAVVTERTVRIPSTQPPAAPFPGFSASCRELGLSSVAAFPIRHVDGRIVAMLMITSYDHHGFAVADMRIAHSIGEAALTHLDDPTFVGRTTTVG